MIVWNTALSLGVLGVATVDDVMTRKVHNVLLLGLAVLSLGFIFYFAGIRGLERASFGLLTGLMLYLPLAYLGVIGGGDMKLLAVVGLSLGPWETFIVGSLALGWAAALGILQVLFKGQFKNLLGNMFKVVKREKVESQQLHKIPYSAALLLAALTEWTLTRHGGMAL